MELLEEVSHQAVRFWVVAVVTATQSGAVCDSTVIYRPILLWVDILVFRFLQRM